MGMKKQIEKEIEREADEIKTSFSSIEFKQSTKGLGIKVKLYTSDTDEEINRVVKKAEKEFDRLRKKYKNKI